jgi:hypothetical protein
MVSENQPCGRDIRCKQREREKVLQIQPKGGRTD